MVETEQDVGGDAEPYYEGDSLKLTFDVNNRDDTDKNLDGASAEWELKNSTETLLTDSDTGVSTTVDEANNNVVIKLDAGATDGMAGVQEHFLRVDDGTDIVTVAVGSFVIDSR